MSTLADRVRAAVDAGDEDEVVGLLRELPEADRAALQPLARAVAGATVKRGMDAAGHLGPMLLLAYATLPLSEIRKLGWRSNHVPKRLDEVLRGRPAERLEPIVAFLLDDVGGWAWRSVRRLVRDGFVARPERPSYTIAMLAGTRYGSVAELLAADPGLLEVEAWRLFEVEGGGEDSLSSHEKYTGDQWGNLFRELAAAEPAMRDRLLDASLAALGRDFAPFRAGWFSRFHESLAPTDAERADRVGAYLGLLRSRVGPTVSFAVAALGRIQRAGRLDPDDLLDRIGAVLAAGPAGTAKAALALVARAGAKDDLRARRASIVAGEALVHASADVQQAALVLIGTLTPGPDVELAGALEERLGGVAASQRAAATGLLARLDPATTPGSIDVARDAAPVSAASAPRSQLDAGRAPVLDPGRAITPIETVEELADVAIAVLETGEPADDLERILDAVGRLAGERSTTAERLAPAIAKRARTILARRATMPFAGVDARADIAAVLLAWAVGDLTDPDPRARNGAGAFLSARAVEIATAAVRHEPRVSVAAPTHLGGWIDPAVLVGRLGERAPGSALDLVAALLRLAPDGRDDALRAAADQPGEVGAVLRYALGGEERVGPTAAWWVAAARVRAPGRDDPAVERRHPGLGPDAGRAARITIRPHRGERLTWGIQLDVDPPALDDAPGSDGARVDLPTVALLRAPNPFSWAASPETATLRWIATIWPGDRESWAAVGTILIGRNVDWWSAEWANRVYLEPFLDPLTPIGPAAQLLIAIALGAKEPGERGLAADVTRKALAEGRLTPDGLAAGLRESVAIDCDRPKRWAIALADVAADEPGLAHAVAGAVLLALPALAVRPAGTMVPLLRLLDELLAERSTPPAELALRAAEPVLREIGRATGQAGRLARSVAARARA